MNPDELKKSLVGLFAYDDGAVDSGIRDEVLRERCVVTLRDLDGPEWRLFISRAVRDTFLSEDALEQGYGIADAYKFVKWLDNRMGQDTEGTY